MTPEQMDGWLAYYQVEPWGETRADLRSASSTQAIFAGLTGEEVDVDQFMPFPDPDQDDADDWDEDEADDDDEDAYEIEAQQQMQVIRQFAARHNAAERAKKWPQ